MNIYASQSVISKLTTQNYDYLIKASLYIALLCNLFSYAGYSQDWKLTIRNSDPGSQFDRYIKDSNFSIPDSLALVDHLRGIIEDLNAEGFLLAEVENIDRIDSVFIAHINLNEQFKWAKLSRGNVPEVILSKLGYREKFYRNTIFKSGEASRLLSGIINYSQNHGYPFALVSLDSVNIEGHTINSTLNFNKGPFIRFDSIEFTNDVTIKKSWLQAYLQIQPGEAFSQKTIDRIADRLSALDFVQLQESPGVTFQNEEATVYLSLKNIPTNRIDGIIGFLPNEKEDGGLLVTGQFDMELRNLFASGKSLGVHWQSLKPRSQLLEINYKHRNLLHSPLNLDASFYLLKEDTSFTNRRGRFSINYKPSSHEVNFFTSIESSRLIGEQPEEEMLLEKLNFNITYYGVGYGYDNLRKSRVPNGFTTYVESAIGDKALNRDPQLPDSAYQDIDLSTTQFKFQGRLDVYKPISKLLGLRVGVKGGKLINDRLLLNDLFRVGGLQSLRGFNENFFFASEFLLSNIELRLHYEQSSYIFLFYDQSYVYYNLESLTFEDYPLGIGLGLSMATKNGIINLAYGLGKSNGQPLSLSLSKFHFGYVAKF